VIVGCAKGYEVDDVSLHPNSPTQKDFGASQKYQTNKKILNQLFAIVKTLFSSILNEKVERLHNND
jgi:hypothetical protein